MQVREIMTSNPECCTPDTNLQEVAKMMVDSDCGAIPVVDDKRSMRPVGVITDRDICCRTVAEGKNPLEMTAGDCMTGSVVTVSPEMSVEDVCTTMEDRQVRRIPVVDGDGRCCGMVAQADIARKATAPQTAEVVKEVSQESAQATNG